MIRPALLTLVSLSLSAQSPASPTRTWTDKTTLSFVSTRGNAASDTFGFSNAFTWGRGLDGIAFNLGAIRATSESVARRAVGTGQDAFGLEEVHTRTTSAEQLFANLRFDRKFKDAWYWYGGAGWERNRPAGLDGRTSVTAGLGRMWVQNARTTLKTDLGFGHTWESPVVAPAGARTRFGTGVLTARLVRKIGEGAEYAADLGFTENLADTADWQAILRQGLSVSLNKRLALKVGYDLVTRNRPKLVAVDLFPSATAPAPIGKVNIEARKTDTLFTTSLVITF